VTPKFCRISGEAFFIFTRGKKKLGYELKMRVKYQGILVWLGFYSMLKGTQDYRDGRGLIEFKEFCDDTNYESTITSRGRENKEVCRTAVKEQLDDIAAHIRDALKTIM
jgi:hypothetical protein